MIEPTGYTALDLIGFTDRGYYDPSATYVKNDLVHDDNESIWRVLIDDTSGVTPTEGLNYTIFIRNPQDAAKQMIASVETSPTANAHAADTQIIYHDVLYDVTTAIAAGGALVVYPTSGYNIKPAPLVTSQIQALANNKQDKNLSAPIASQNTVEGALQAVNNNFNTFKDNSLKVFPQLQSSGNLMNGVTITVPGTYGGVNLFGLIYTRHSFAYFNVEVLSSTRKISKASIKNIFVGSDGGFVEENQVTVDSLSHTFALTIPMAWNYVMIQCNGDDVAFSLA